MRCKHILLAGVLLATGQFFAGNVALAEESSVSMVYDEAAYTEYVEATMQKLDALYLEFCAACNVDASRAGAAKREFLATVRDLMQYMNGRVD